MLGEPAELTLVLGNSGAGKTYLSRALAEHWGARTVDLDPLAWHPSVPPQRRAASDTLRELEPMLSGRCLVEGCYEDIMELLLPRQPWLIFLNPPLERCLENCRSRRWEPHKFSSPECQQEQLEFLLSWVRSYYEREDGLSLRAHRRVFDSYNGRKLELTEW